MISRTTNLHLALTMAAQRELAYFSGLLGGHRQGFGWRDGGAIPQWLEDALQLLDRVHLIRKIPAAVCREVGAVVFTPPDGYQVLSEWDAQINGAQISPARSAGVQLRAGDTIGGAQ